MAYDFVADAEKLGDLKTDLTTAATEIANYTEDIYSKIADLNTVWSGDAYDAFKAKSELYRKHMDRLSEVLTEFSEKTDEFGGETSTFITNVKRLLSCNTVTVSDGTSGVNSTAVVGRSKNADGTYQLDTTTSDYNISIPSDTTVSNENWGCAEVGDDLFLQAQSIGSNLDSEIQTLKAYKKEHAAEFDALPEPLRSSTIKQLDAQISQREEVLGTINDAIGGGTWEWDGALFNCTSLNLTGNYFVGMTQQSTVDTAVKCARGINDDLNNLASMDEIQSFLLDCGVGM